MPQSAGGSSTAARLSGSTAPTRANASRTCLPCMLRKSCPPGLRAQHASASGCVNSWHSPSSTPGIYWCKCVECALLIMVCGCGMAISICTSSLWNLSRWDLLSNFCTHDFGLAGLPWGFFSVFAGSAVYLECVWWWFKLCSACMQPFHQQSTGHESMLVACSQHQRKCLAIIVCRLIHHVGQTAITAEPTMQRVKLWMWPVSFQHTACLESPCNCHTDCKSFQPQSMS